MQIAHFAAGPVAADITAGIEPGRYLAQPRGTFEAVGVLYATAAAAPADADDYFQCRGGASFLFYAGPDVGPTWVRAVVGVEAVARAKL